MDEGTQCYGQTVEPVIGGPNTWKAESQLPGMKNCGLLQGRVACDSGLLGFPGNYSVLTIMRTAQHDHRACCLSQHRGHARPCPAAVPGEGGAMGRAGDCIQVCRTVLHLRLEMSLQNFPGCSLMKEI